MLQEILTYDQLEKILKGFSITVFLHQNRMPSPVSVDMSEGGGLGRC